MHEMKNAFIGNYDYIFEISHSHDVMTSLN